MSTEVKFRVVLSRYDIYNLPECKAIEGFILDTIDEARNEAEKKIKEIFNNRFIRSAHPGYRIDPLCCELDLEQTTRYIIWYDNKLCCQRIPLVNVTVQRVDYNFSCRANIIDYRGMQICKYLDKWYVSSKLDHQIIGIIDDPLSINEACAEADKIWEGITIDHKEPEVDLPDN